MNQYQALQSATDRVTLKSFNINAFYPPAKPSLGLDNLFAGFGALFGIAAGFAPEVGVLSSFVPAIGSFLSNEAQARSNPLLPQQEFAPQVSAIYKAFTAAIETVGEILFSGDLINGTDSHPPAGIRDLLSNGSWADRGRLTPLSRLEDSLRTEILSRSINALWRNTSHSKMWVTYVETPLSLGDEGCRADKTGPQESKYCGKGGVYYAYNFKETGDHRGILTRPWGADNLPKVGLNLTARKCLPRPFLLSC